MRDLRLLVELRLAFYEIRLAMYDTGLIWLQARYQLISTLRNRRAVIFSLVFPVLLLVLFNSLFADDVDSVELSGATVTAAAYFAGGMLAYAILLSAFNSVALQLVNQRETGQLKRYRGTPVPAWTFIAAVLVRAVVMVAGMAVILLGIAVVAYGVEISAAGLAEIVVYTVIGTASLCSLGVAVTVLVNDVDTATAALPLSAFLLSFISGVFVPVDQIPDWLELIARVFPLYYLSDGIQTALGVSGDTSLDLRNVAALSLWLVIGVIAAARSFRWEPIGIGS